jgi:transcriptional regulator with XRE-family HTH domain
MLKGKQTFPSASSTLISDGSKVPYMETLGQRIDRRMRSKGHNQTSLAREVGVKRAAVSQWISGETKELKGKNLTRVCQVLECTPEWLLTGKGSPEPATCIGEPQGEYNALTEKQRLLIAYIRKMTEAEQEHYLREFQEKEQAQRELYEELKRRFENG